MPAGRRLFRTLTFLQPRVCTILEKCAAVGLDEIAQDASFRDDLHGTHSPLIFGRLQGRPHPR